MPINDMRYAIGDRRYAIRDTRYDAIIVGARPAGAGLAAFLSQGGFRVLLMDRVTFPKPTLSCPLYFGNAFDLLKRIGVMEKVDALGAPKLRWYQVQIQDIHLRGQMLPYNGFDYAYHIRRELFDEMLFKHVAAMPNVETRLGFNVTSLIWENERVIGVRGREQGGDEIEIHGEVVIGADGIFSTVAEQVNAKKYNVVPAQTCVYYAYYDNVAMAGNEPTATMYYDPKEHFAFITANGESDLTVISMSLPASKFDWARANFETLHFDFANKIPEMAERMKNAKRVTPVYGVSPRESFYRVPFGKGWALVGDAAFYKDPLPGQGIHDALRSAELVTQALVECRANGKMPRAWENAFRNYHTTRDRETKAMYELTDLYAQLERERSRQEMDLFRALAASPEWSNRYVSLFNGVTSLEWFQRWDTLMRILLGWRWGQVKGKLLGANGIRSNNYAKSPYGD